MENKKWNSQINNVPVYPDPRRRKRMWEENGEGRLAMERKRERQKEGEIEKTRRKEREREMEAEK